MLKIEHIFSNSRDGSNLVSNLTQVCRPCNEAKAFSWCTIRHARRWPMEDSHQDSQHSRCLPIA